VFRRFGSRVTVIERAETFLPREDADVAEQVLQVFREDGIDVPLGASVRQVEGLSGQSIQVRLQTPSGERTVQGSDLLAALGRVPNTEELNLSAAGVGTDNRGFIRRRPESGLWAT
jgi:pyruvate/2-oxoglutarate dehydrogenase complex dihydrolipoamide dehydrogenase (E3) component